MKKRTQTVIVLGASNKTHRYSYKAIKLLKEYGHNILPVHPKLSSIDGLPVISSLSSIHIKVDTLTLYVGEEKSRMLIDEIIALNPKRVIFNPGTESKILVKKLTQAEIPFIHDCTLIMLETNRFDISTH
ncbi:MAG: CoA-binding protein [Gammaproteobacteria bacterium]|nr:CoA-binding protein [Gammaproteobacteria bacterium]